MPHLLLDFDEMYEALVNRDQAYDGVFFVGVKSTGIFCRATCPARKPKRENVSFFASTADALAAGYRPCKRCRPMEVAGSMPQWLRRLVDSFEQRPERKWTDEDIRQLDVDPKRARRWFLSHHGMTFHSFLRSRRLATALSRLSLGDGIDQVAFDAGYESVSGFREAFQNWCGCPPGRARAASVGYVNRLLTPLGPMIVVANESQVQLLEFADRRGLQTQIQRLIRLTGESVVPGECELMEQAQEQLDEYFLGQRQRFELPLLLKGTRFQQAVWEQLLSIEFGRTLAYEEIARQVSSPNACRAVGRANGDNRLAIVVPCHRVIRRDGSLSGYAGGLRRKQWLLDHERACSLGSVNDNAHC